MHPLCILMNGVHLDELLCVVCCVICVLGELHIGKEKKIVLNNFFFLRFYSV